MKKTALISAAIARTGARSAWNRGVCEYIREIAAELPDELKNETVWDLDKAMLCGARDWNQYSRGGCSLITDDEIAQRLCTPSELKRNATRRGRRDWLGVQTEALCQASLMITEAYIFGGY